MIKLKLKRIVDQLENYEKEVQFYQQFHSSIDTRDALDSTRDSIRDIQHGTVDIQHGTVDSIRDVQHGTVDIQDIQIPKLSFNVKKTFQFITFKIDNDVVDVNNLKLIVDVNNLNVNLLLFLLVKAKQIISLKETEMKETEMKETNTTTFGTTSNSTTITLNINNSTTNDSTTNDNTTNDNTTTANATQHRLETAYTTNSEIEWIMKEMTFHQIFLVVQFIIIPMITIDLIEKYQSL